LRERTNRLIELLARVEGTPPAPRRREIRVAFRSFAASVDEWLKQCSAVSAEARQEAMEELRERFLDEFLEADGPRRFYEKPRGYAGDSESIEMIYDNRPSGRSAVGRILDECFLAQPAAAAVRNRRGLLATWIRETVERKPEGETARIASMASGPARELFDVLEDESLARSLHATCVDFDADALRTVADRQRQEFPGANLHLLRENLISVAFGRRELSVEPLDLAYSIGLIDYFQDRLVVKFLDSLHDRLAPGGMVILGNFHPSNPDRGIMECFLEWNLIHRCEVDMERLFAASSFGPDSVEIVFEEERVNLFALARKRA
jgi:SAM-dependent methyltransferase